MNDIVVAKKGLKVVGSCRSTHIKNISQFRANHAIMQGSAARYMVKVDVERTINSAMGQIVRDLSGVILWK